MRYEFELVLIRYGVCVVDCAFAVIHETFILFDSEIATQWQPMDNNEHITPFRMIKRQQRAPKKAGILFSENEITSAFVAYNKIIAERGKCVCVTSKLSNKHKHKLMKCECLSTLLVADTAVQKTIYKSIAAYQLSFGALLNTEQQFCVLEWMKYAENKKKTRQTIRAT